MTLYTVIAAALDSFAGLLHELLLYWIPSHVGIISIEKADAAAKAGLLRRVTDIPIPYCDFKKHINVLLKRKWQSQWDEAVNKNHM